MKNNAFQYYNGIDIVEDQTELTLEEAKELWNDHYDNMVSMVKQGYEIEVAIWIRMKDKATFGETLIHLHSPTIENGALCETVTNYYRKFDNSQPQ